MHLFESHLLEEPSLAAPKRNRIRTIVGGIFAALLALFTLGGYYLGEYMAKRPSDQPAKPSAVTQEAPAAQPQPAVSASAQLEDRLKSATIRRGEGIEHALIRQLLANPNEYGFSGDAANHRALKRWAARRAHTLAVRAGYFDWKFGAEIRVKRPDKIAYLLEKDDSGKLRIAEYAASPQDGFGSSPAPQKTLALASRNTRATFIGWPGAHRSIPTYEYLYTG